MSIAEYAQTPKDQYSQFTTISLGSKGLCGGLTFKTVLSAAHNRMSLYTDLAIGRTLKYIPPDGESFINSTIKIQNAGETHDLHSDGYTWDTSRRGEKLPVLSSIICLGDEYDGGELEFPEHSARIKMPIGSAVFFPSMIYEHKVNTVISGKRFTLLNFWLEM
jgi:predicted 2-oxoglutarate/Fe(II)-dependent dioxygenase YbiX